MLEITSEDEINKRLKWFARIDPQRCLLPGKQYDVAKRLLDVLVVLCSLPFWLPILFVTSVWIKLSEPRCPVLFRQWRSGKKGEYFQIYKFRTMVANADQLKEQYQYLNELQWPDFKIQNDPRITHVGKIIRKFSLDELPQLFNVLRGEMSVVGPRPTHIPLEQFKLWHTRRLEVLPGITGLWQIVGRCSTLFDTRVRLDIAYIEKRCLWLDIQILFRTIISVIKQRGSF